MTFIFLNAFIFDNNVFSQAALTGTSYFQDFNSIAAPGVLPSGWGVYNNSTAFSLGTPASYNGSGAACGGPNGFYGYASGLAGGSTALGVRQSVGGGNDPGTAFVFCIANTQGRTNFNMSFYLQSLCAVGGRTVTWNVDYGFGAFPGVFTNAGTTPAVLTTSSGAPSNTIVTVNFGAALNNNAGPVWIRVVTKNASVGGGGMPYTAIDNFNLNWTCNTSLSVSSGGTVCNGGSINLSASPTGTAPYTYSWTGPSAFTSTTQNPVIAGATASNAGTYTCVTTSSGGCAARELISVPVNVPVCTATSATVCSATPAALSVTSSTITAASFTSDNYVRITNGGTSSSSILVSGIAGTVSGKLATVTVNINHPVTSELTLVLTAPSGTQITLSSNDGAGALYTNTIFSTAGPPISGGANPFTGTYTPDQAFSLLNASNISGVWDLTVTDNTNNNNLGGIVSWDLNFSIPNSYSWSPITGLSSSTLPNVTATNAVTTNYIVTNTDFGGCVATGNSTYSVSPAPTATAPSNQTICQGANANFSTTVVGGIPPYTYQWQEDNGGGYANITNGGVYGGATTGNLLITAALVGMNSYRYRCVVNDACGSVLSGNAQLFVTPAISYASSSATQPITSDVTRCEANAVILRMNINMNSGSCPSTPSVIGFNVTMSGTFLEASNVQVYYTGAVNSFTPINQFGSNYVPNNTLAISGSQVLSGGNNYFWLVYDINPNGTGALVDATWEDFTIVGGNNPGTYVPPVTAPGPGRSITTCPAPGGVITGLTYWLKSNDGSNVQSTTHDAPIGLWGSSFSNGYDLQQTNGTKKPQFKNYSYDTTFNFNPYLSFDGSNDILQNTSLLGSGLLDDDGLALVVCATAVAPNNNSVFGYKEADGGPIFEINPESGMLLANSAGKLTEIQTTDFTQPATDFPMAKLVGIRGVSAGPDFADFVRNSEIILPTLGGTAVAEDGLSLGANGDGITHGNNTVAEIITYSGGVSATDLQRIQTYVGIKYGIHMEQDYIASDGSTVIWDYITNASYDFDIAGIARDDKSGLHQKQSQSVNTDEILTVGLTSIELSNGSNTESFADDKSYLLWGNNDEITVSDYSTLAPTATPLLPAGIQGRIKRVWKFQGTNFNTLDFNRINGNQNGEKAMATKTLTLGFDAHTLAGSFAAGPNNTIKVLVDDDGVDWSDAVVVGGAVVVGTTTASGARIMVPNVTVEPDKNYVTLATTNASMLPLASEITHFSAECKTNYNLVKWITATEISVDDFTLQSSTDAIHFYDVYTVGGKGNHNTYNIYTFEHTNPQRKNLYYRIKQKTDNGNYVYSKSITTDNSCKVVADEKLSVSILPNPVVGNINNAELFYSGAQEGKGIIEIKNSLGATLYKLAVEISDELGSVNLPTNYLKAGVYIVSLISGNQSKSVKLVKE